MNEAQVNARADGTLDGGGGGASGGVDWEKLWRLWLRGFLRELVRQEVVTVDPAEDDADVTVLPGPWSRSGAGDAGGARADAAA